MPFGEVRYDAFNVRDFGAKCDSTGVFTAGVATGTDDTDAFERACEAAAAVSFARAGRVRVDGLMRIETLLPGDPSPFGNVFDTATR